MFEERRRGPSTIKLSYGFSNGGFCCHIDESGIWLSLLLVIEEGLSLYMPAYTCFKVSNFMTFRE